ncbi:MAG: MarR family winged helix-turn-helix transcriptional regulator [Marmoricola sp.]
MAEREITGPGAAPAIGMAVRDVLRLAPDVHAALARRLGVGVTDLLALDHLSVPPAPEGVVDLGRRLGVTSASATVLVDRLVAAAHVRRVPHPHDRRRTRLEMTDHAETEVRAALEPLITGLGTVVAGLDEEQAATVLGFLTDLVAVLTRFAAEPH